MDAQVESGTQAEGTSVSLPLFSVSLLYFTLFLQQKQLIGLGFLLSDLYAFVACIDCALVAGAALYGGQRLHG